MVQELSLLKNQLFDVFPVGALVGLCRTLDQGKAVTTLLDAILDKTLQSTIALTASRGRGKSAALGLAVAGAVAAGYPNIFVTAPTPQNLSSLFEFIRKGLHVLKYEEHLQYDVVRSGNHDSRKAIIQINIYKQHRQTIQYIEPHNHLKLSQVDLLVIDEAAVIPLSIIKLLIRPCLVFLSSTVNGYEGTGCSLSLKLFGHLEKKSQMSPSRANDKLSASSFKRLELKESIRYASEDPIEYWLNDLLCLDATSSIPTISRYPHPSECQLYYVNRDTLFSFHKESETFLQQMMSLFVASHYKYSPDDLQLMADAPAHHLFVLLGPIDESKNILPNIFCVVQVCLEGLISRDSALQCLRIGHQPPGDQIPWKFCKEFGNKDFPMLSGLHVIRIAVHPSALGHGYGSAALDLLTRYYEGQLTVITEDEIEMKDKLKFPVNVNQAAEKVSLLEEKITPREDLPPLLIHLRDRAPEKIHYIGASFGLTLDLFRFWKKHKFAPFHICDTPNNITGEHSCMVLKPLESNEIEGNQTGALSHLSPFYQCFRERFRRRLLLCFREMDYKLAMSILDPKINFSDYKPVVSSENKSSLLLETNLYSDVLNLLEAYTCSRKDYGEVRDLVPVLAQWYFQEKLPITLSYLQASILLCMGLQLRDVTDIERMMNIERLQILCLFRKTMVKFYKHLYELFTESNKNLPKEDEVTLVPHSVSLEDDLEDGAKQVMIMEKMKQQDPVELVDSKLKLLEQYSIEGSEEFEDALRGFKTISPSGLLSVKSNRKSSKDDQTKNKRKRDHKQKSCSKQT
ncbi:putative P-loop ATPase fused to an acetyltransferase [Handroanthus impetiginosus]|uniref:RNA cytidine acetyltransferase n=1 Tax=Handroanthus impetiginosus TaxID=429701 RepID=A0A2G9I170_9LAMI|nr:putative P-loop ATPase fused to an acetyltransferase [Handroanthus impetiginosus]